METSVVAKKSSTTKHSNSDQEASDQDLSTSSSSGTKTKLKSKSKSKIENEIDGDDNNSSSNETTTSTSTVTKSKRKSIDPASIAKADDEISNSSETSTTKKTKTKSTIIENLISEEDSTPVKKSTKRLSAQVVTSVSTQATPTDSHVGRQRSSTSADLKPLSKKLGGIAPELERQFSKDDSSLGEKKRRSLTLTTTKTPSKEVVPERKTTSTKRKAIKLKSRDRDTIFKERDEFATEIENAGKDLKLDKTVRSNTDIINQIASKQDNFGQQMSSQSQTLSNDIGKLGSVFEASRKEGQQLLARVAAQTTQITVATNEIDDDESTEELAKKIRHKWDLEKKQAEAFEKSWRGFVMRNFKWFAGGGIVLLLVLLYFFAGWIWRLLMWVFGLIYSILPFGSNSKKEL